VTAWWCADRIESGSDGAGRVGKFAHLGDAARVVGDRAVASSATMIPVNDSMEVAAIAIAVEPCELVGDEDRGAHRDHGQAVALIETPRPAMMLVACPVVEGLRDVRTGEYSVRCSTRWMTTMSAVSTRPPAPPPEVHTVIKLPVAENLDGASFTTPPMIRTSPGQRRSREHSPRQSSRVKRAHDLLAWLRLDEA